MTPFYTRFPELAARETRCIHVVTPGGPLPIGEYGFIELYCEDPGCDCRRVLLQVTTPQAPHTALATINYGWESAVFYTRWMHGDTEAGRDITEASLDPLNPQSQYADHLLGIFRDIVETDSAYVARLARHYAMFKNAPGYQPAQPNTPFASKNVHEGERNDLRAATDGREDFRPAAQFKQLNDLIQQGYDLLESHQAAAACDVWLRAWERFCALYGGGSFASLRAFDDRFHGTQFVSNWVQDLEMELQNAGRKNPVYYEHRVRYCEDFLKRFGKADDLMRENMRRAVAESWAKLGRRDRSDALFEQWLQDDPQWGWGWIGWADTYSFSGTPDRDLARAEQLLKRGLDVEGVHEGEYIIERLINLYEEQGRTAEAGTLRQTLKTIHATTKQADERPFSSKTKLGLSEEGIPLEDAGQVLSELPQLSPRQRRLVSHGKPGRNDPCPCGSGKKYKKCCGKN